MRFKDASLQGEFVQLPTLLQAICADFERLSQTYGVDPLVTRVFEHVCGDSGVHEAHRAVDFRDEHDGSFLYEHESREAICKILNSKYSRRDGKPTVLWHSFQGAPHHFHVQLAADVATYFKQGELTHGLSESSNLDSSGA
jgi:hypothetical protein